MSDERWMRAALEEGQKGLGLTAPNPPVGAVLVRNGEIIGRGWHQKAGHAHAEREAIADARARNAKIAGSEIFVTLEPCSTQGRTGACTSAMLQESIARVVWSCRDPNPTNQGKARSVLESAGVEVSEHVLESEGHVLIRGFRSVIERKRPWVIAKVGASLDGRLTRPPGEPTWLTSTQSRADVQNLRKEADAILTSGVTARIDNPRLTYRGSCKDKQPPLRIVLSSQHQGGLSSDSHLLRESNNQALFFSESPRQVFQMLAERGVQIVLVEAGGTLLGSLLDENLVDEWVSYVSPLVTGGFDPVTKGDNRCELSERLTLSKVSYHQIGNDFRVRGLLNSP
ncbi:MAG: bifunctional diaminohydroxyphosphoribosylaminopyrimidine deaminase/5-amino-6-(5-phosphoribosylamino)uracil reductase RibD [Verrucomicrobiota bacterium]